MSEKIYFKIHRKDNEIIFAAADENVIDKKHVGNGRVLDLIAFASFYKGELISAKDASKAFDECTIANLVGKSAVSLAIEKKLITEEQIVQIGDASHVQLFKIAQNK